MIPLVLPSMRIGLDTMRTNPVRHRLRQLNHGTVIFKILMGSFAAISLAVGAIAS